MKKKNLWHFLVSMPREAFKIKEMKRCIEIQFSGPQMLSNKINDNDDDDDDGDDDYYCY